MKMNSLKLEELRERDYGRWVLSKHGEPKTSSILLITLSIFIGIILLMYSGLMYTEAIDEAFTMYLKARMKAIEPNYLDECDARARKFERVLENFKKEYLSETGQKTKKSHEKSG